MQALGVRRTLTDLVNEVERDRAWYEATGGGVTLSGGEPASQPAFARAFLSACRERGLSTAMDTCGQAPEPVFAQLLNGVDLLLFDLKHCEENEHRRLTGAGLQTIHANLLEAAARARQGRLRLWVRTPLIPGAAAGREVLAGIGAFLRERLPGAVERWELCAFNPSCGGKYRRLGEHWAYEGAGLLMEKDTGELLSIARRTCGMPERVFLVGVRKAQRA